MKFLRNLIFICLLLTSISVAQATYFNFDCIIDQLPDNIRWQRTSTPVLPSIVAGIVNGETIQIPVIWAADGYKGSASLPGLYVFIAKPLDGNTFATEAPRITVMLLPAIQLRAEGIGNSSSPLEITNPAQLAEIAALVNEGNLEKFITGSNANTVYIKLINDIDLFAYGVNWNGGKGWIPIGYDDSKPFKGHFDGGGNTIYNLYINHNGYISTGLFGSISEGSIINTGIVNAKIIGGNNTGGVAGNTSGNLKFCYFTGSVSGTGNLGGIVGYAYGTNIIKCYSTGNINGTSGNVGGIAGFVDINSSVTNCYSTSAITDDNNAGGIAGIVYGIVSDCAALNSCVKGIIAGRVAGYNVSGSALSGNIAFDGITDGSTKLLPGGNNNNINGKNISAAEIIADGTLGGLFIDNNPWTCNDGYLPCLFGKTVPIPVHILVHSFNSGDGTDETNAYVITKAEQLAWLAMRVSYGDTDLNDKYYKLGNNIDLSAYGSGEGWMPIGNSIAFPFKGHFDGAEHTISNLFIDYSGINPIGLFGVIDGGSVKNLGIKNAIISGYSNAGGVTGDIKNGILKNCYVTGAVSGTENRIGGVVGTVESGSISDCYSTCVVSGINYVGGIAGYFDDGSVSNCYTTGAISGVNYVGGLIGVASCNVSDCAALNSIVKGTANVGRVVGYNDGFLSDNMAFDNMEDGGGVPFTLNAITLAHDGIDGEDISVSEIITDGTLGGLFTNDGDPWTCDDGKLPGLFGLTVDIPAHIYNPDGSLDFPYIITTAEELAWLAEQVNNDKDDPNGGKFADKYYKLGADIDLADYLSPSGVGYNSGKGWISIGNKTSFPFKGYFNGNDYTISNLYINYTGINSIGLFGVIAGGTVANLGIINVNIIGDNYTGGVAGYVDAGSISTCYVTGTIYGNSSVGGIAGKVNLSNVSDCYVTAAVNGITDVGGIVGYMTTSGSMNNCYAIGTVVGDENIGGVAGGVLGIVTDCAALNPSVKGLNLVGRVVGLNFGTLSSNLAFNGMTDGGGTPFTLDAITLAHDGIDGEDITAVQIVAGTDLFTGRFPDGVIWTSVSGKLPGLFGNTVTIPVHILVAAYGHPFDSGDGSDEDNAYIITTPEQLVWFAERVNADDTNFNEKFYRLGTDIDLNEYGKDWNGGKGWIPIGFDDSNPFKGYFDGAEYTISNLFIDYDGYNTTGFFGTIEGGCVANLGIVNADINGLDNVGGLTGNVNRGNISNCYVAGTISSTGENIGGIVGFFQNGSISYCYATSAVSGNNNVGGIVGINTGNISDCAVMNPSVKGSSDVGRVVGYDTGILSDNFAYNGMTDGGGTPFTLNATTNLHDGIDGEDIYAADIIADGTIGGLFGNVGDPWTTEDGELPGLFGQTVTIPSHIYVYINPFDSGDGSDEDNAYIIITPEQLAWLADAVNTNKDDPNGGKYAEKYYKLGADIDLGDYLSSSGAGYNSGEGWIPIGNNINFFKGFLNGDGNILSNLYIEQVGNDFIGFFGIIEEGSVINLGIVNADIRGDNFVGGVVGLMNYGSIDNCYVTGSISGNDNIGGIAGLVSNGIVNKCYTTTAINGNSIIGGVAGIVSNTGNINNCYATGSVSGNTAVGGVVGTVDGSASNSYSTSTVIGNEYYIGGVVGVVSGSVINCVALNPNVKGNTSVGRVVGFNDGGIFSNNYAFVGMGADGGTAFTLDSNTKAYDGIDGEDLSKSDAIDLDFWTTATNWNTASWDTDTWSIDAGRLPLLENMPGGLVVQNGDPGLYMTRNNLTFAYLAQVIYEYTGSKILPILKWGDGTELEENKDYEITITSVDGGGESAGTNVGEVTVEIIGIGDYKGAIDLTYTIEAKLVSFEGTVIATKTYDGTKDFDATHITIDDKENFNDVEGADEVFLEVLPSATFQYGPRVGNGTLAITNVFTLAGLNANNYILSEPINVDVSITPKPVTISGITATKIYDGTSSFTNGQIDITGATINDILHPNIVSIDKTGVTGGNFGPGVGTGNLVHTGSFTLTGGDAGNYILSAQPTVEASITACSITVTALNGSSTYGENPANPGFSASGLPTGVNISVLTGISVNFNINSTTPVDSYDLYVVGTLTNSDYTISTRYTGTWVVNKAAGSFKSVSALNVTYTPTLKLNDLTLQAGYSWNLPGTVLNAGDGQDFSATYIDPSGNYTLAYGLITVNVAKAVGADVIGSPTLSGTPLGTRITVNTLTIPVNPGNQDVEYAISLSNSLSTAALDALVWQSGTTFTGLSPHITYYVYARSAANTNYTAGNAKMSSAITTGEITGNEDIHEVKELTAWIYDGTLYVSGLTPGKIWSIYNISGMLIYQSPYLQGSGGVVESRSATSILPARGIYIIRSEGKAVRIRN